MKLFPDWLNWSQTQSLIKAFGGDVGKLRFVGGVVRDSLLNINVSDVDAATIFTPQQVTTILEKAAIRVIPTGIKHGTVTALIDGKHFEITTLRRDLACDGRHAEVAFTDSWQEDAARRDFTMNALYISADGEVFDYFGGIEDARAGRVRFIGDARARISEDYLRILRFFRFFAYYGKGVADEAALAACAELSAKIATLSSERIQHEMLKLLAAEKPFSALELMQNGGVLEQVCGFKICLGEAIDYVDEAELRLALLPIMAENISAVEALEILAVRWRLSNELKKYLFILITHINDVSYNIPLARQKHLLRTLGKEVFTSIVLLKIALTPAENYSQIMELAQNWQIPIMPISGKDLIALGISEGKELGKKLHELEILWEKSDYKLSKEKLLAYLSPSSADDSDASPTGNSSSA